MDAFYMGHWAWQYATKVFASGWYFFNRILESSGTKFFYLTTVLAAIAFRILAAPLLGDALASGSDWASEIFRKRPYSKHGGLSVVRNYGSKSHSTGIRRR